MPSLDHTPIVALTSSDGPKIAWSARLGRLEFDPGQQVQLPDPRAVTDLKMMLERGDTREAQYIVEASFTAAFPVSLPAAVLVLCQQWQAGRWRAVKRLWSIIGFDALYAAFDKEDHVIGRLLLEIAAEFDFANLVNCFASGAIPKIGIAMVKEPPAFAMALGPVEFAMFVAGDATDYALGAMASYLDREATEEIGYARAQSDALRERLQLQLVESADQATVATMPLNPYAAFLAARVRDNEVVAATIKGYDLPKIASYFAPNVMFDKLASYRIPTAIDRIDALEALGLTAEWATGLASYHRIADLSMIARSADRWRRTMSGVWSYDSKSPDDWRGREDGLDDSATALIDHILAQPDLSDAAIEALFIWMPKDADCSRLLRRYQKRYDVARLAARPVGTGSPRAAAQGACVQLMNAKIPMAIAVPLAVLAASNFELKNI